MIKHIIYHIINKDAHGVGVVQENPEELPNDQLENRLLEELDKSYTEKAGKGYGYFEEDIDLYPISNILNDYLEYKDTFYDCSKRMLKVLCHNINDPSATAAKGGCVFIAHYENNNHEYLLVALISERTTYAAVDWGINERNALNIDQLKFAGRIDITAWKEGKERYISFLKGKGEVAQYFKKFLACNDVLIDQAETAKLVKLMQTFSDEISLDLIDKTKLLDDAKSYLIEISNADERFMLESFANRIWPTDPSRLIIHLSSRDDSLGVSDGFKPDKRSLRALTVHSHKTKHWSCTFDNQAMVDGLISKSGNKIIINQPGKLLEAFDHL